MSPAAPVEDGRSTPPVAYLAWVGEALGVLAPPALGLVVCNGEDLLIPTTLEGAEYECFGLMFGGVTDPPPMYFGLLPGAPPGVVYLGGVVGRDGLGSVVFPEDPVAGDDDFDNLGI